MPPVLLNDLYDTMPWDRIDSVVFDVGNVLLSFQPDQILRDLVPDHPELYPVLRLKVFNSPYWIMMDHGTAGLVEAERLMIGRDVSLTPYIHNIMTKWVEMKDVVHEGVRALSACRAHGKKTYVLSNYGDEAFDVVDQKYSFFRDFDGKVISSRVHMVKPDPMIYQTLNETYHLNPERTLFIDDSHVNIEAALTFGWQGICFNAPGLLDRFIC